MLTLPDMRAKQILFVQGGAEAENALSWRNENFLFKKDDAVVNQASCHKLLAVFVVGDCTITSKLMKECRRRAVSLFMLNNSFSIYASINARAEGNYALRNRQHEMSETKKLLVAKMLVTNKVRNQANLLCSLDGVDRTDEVEEITKKINRLKKPDGLLGLEGNFSKHFFKEYFAELEWLGRSPRTKFDIPNLLLDMGYTFMFNFTDSLLQLFGFDTYNGCYHKLFFNRKSLSCDLVEPFRSIVDRQLLKAYHLKQIDEKDFIFTNGRYSLSYQQSRKYAKIFMEAIMERKEEVYTFIQGYYRFVMNDDSDFPTFNIK